MEKEIRKHNTHVAMITIERIDERMSPEEWHKQMRIADKDLKALIIRVTDEIISDDEAFEWHMGKAGAKNNPFVHARNELRNSMRIKRDELLSK